MQAKKALMLNEVPIGCIIVYEDKVIARGYNRRVTDHSTLAHAEINAIKKACRVIGDWRLEDCTMYVTLDTATYKIDIDIKACECSGCLKWLPYNELQRIKCEILLNVPAVDCNCTFTCGYINASNC